MVFTSHPQKEPSEKFFRFLEREIGLTSEAINLGIKYSIKENAPLPIVLWSFGLINLSQLQMIFKWLNTN
mgnify:CR=1 FL=1